MQSLFRILAIALAVIWLPATAHCELEALGTFAAEQATDDGCCDPQAGCTDDACDMIEGENLVPSSFSLKAPVEVVLSESFARLLRAELSASATSVAEPASGYVDHPLDWAPTWHFAHRAAGFARAPSPRA